MREGWRERERGREREREQHLIVDLLLSLHCYYSSNTFFDKV